MFFYYSFKITEKHTISETHHFSAFLKGKRKKMYTFEFQLQRNNENDNKAHINKQTKTFLSVYYFEST